MQSIGNILVSFVLMIRYINNYRRLVIKCTFTRKCQNLKEINKYAYGVKCLLQGYTKVSLSICVHEIMIGFGQVV